MNKKKYKLPFYIIVFYLSVSFINFLWGAFVRPVKLENSSYYFKRYFNKREENTEQIFPKTITDYVKISELTIKEKEPLINNFSDIFEYSLQDIFQKSYKFKSSSLDNSFQKYASQTYDLLNVYKPTSLNNDKKVPGMPKIETINALTNYLISLSYYYAYKKKTGTALLLNYLPILLIYEIEANNIECDNPYIKMSLMEIRNRICMNLLFFANNTPINKDIAIKISKNLIDLAKKEPPIKKYLEYTKSKINKQFLKYRNDKTKYIYNNICNSRFWDETVDYIYESASEEIKKIESGNQAYSLYFWQQGIKELLLKGNNVRRKSFFTLYTDWQRLYTYHLILQSQETFFINFFDLYKKREEYLAIMEGTAIALVLGAYSSDKDSEVDNIYDSMPKNIKKLEEWSGMELPKDRMGKSAFLFNFADDYFLVSSPKQKEYPEKCFNDYYPFLRNRWVINSEPSINGNPIQLKNTSIEQ